MSDLAPLNCNFWICEMGMIVASSSQCSCEEKISTWSRYMKPSITILTCMDYHMQEKISNLPGILLGSYTRRGESETERIVTSFSTLSPRQTLDDFCRQRVVTVTSPTYYLVPISCFPSGHTNHQPLCHWFTLSACSPQWMVPYFLQVFVQMRLYYWGFPWSPHRK